MELIAFAFDELPGAKHFRPIKDKLPKPDLVNGPWVAGGLIPRLVHDDPFWTYEKNANNLYERQALAGDIDYFFASQEQFEATVKHIQENLNLEPVSDTHNAITFNYYNVVTRRCYSIQLIRKRFFTDVRHIFRYFDFTVTQGATDFETVVMTESALPDIDNKTLRIAKDGNVNKVNYFKRVFKYCRNGYDPEPGILGGLAELDYNEFTSLMTVAMSKVGSYDYL